MALFWGGKDEILIDLLVSNIAVAAERTPDRDGKVIKHQLEAREKGLGQVASHYPLDNKPPGLHPA